MQNAVLIFDVAQVPEYLESSEPIYGLYIAGIFWWRMPEGRDPPDGCSGFDWDDGNARKNWDPIAFTPEESEDVFF
jgi:hypothetical protein